MDLNLIKDIQAALKKIESLPEADRGKYRLEEVRLKETLRQFSLYEKNRNEYNERMKKFQERARKNPKNKALSIAVDKKIKNKPN